MSSAPKGERIANDAYFTPDDVAARCVATLDLSGANLILEPSVGGGAFVRAIRRAMVPGAVIIGCDIDANPPGADECDSWHRADFATEHFVCVDWVIGNPPYSHAEAHVRHALTLAPRCAFLLRLAFLESEKRAPFWREHPAAAVYVLSKRPSFTGGGTDSAAYAWFVWDRDHVGPTALRVLGAR